jgi:hypothetical protein
LPFFSTLPDRRRQARETADLLSSPKSLRPEQFRARSACSNIPYTGNRFQVLNHLPVLAALGNTAQTIGDFYQLFFLIAELSE